MSPHITSPALIFAIAFIAVTALALPNSINPLLPRDFPPPLGINQGHDFSGLTFKLYAEKDCKGDPAGIYTGSYGFYEAYQMQSYNLSRQLMANEVLDFYSGLRPDSRDKNKFNHGVNGHYTEACWMYDTTAGVNATTDGLHGTHLGCHTLKNIEWCAMIRLEVPV